MRVVTVDGANTGRPLLLAWPNLSHLRAAMTAASEESCCLLLTEIANFRPFANRYGLAAGERLVLELGKLVSQAVAPHTLFRLATDEFASCSPAPSISQQRSSAAPALT
jgi:GGDEF domain-containing protein